MKPEIAGQDTRAVVALMMAQGEKKGRCLGIRGEGPLVCKGEPGSGEAYGLKSVCALKEKNRGGNCQALHGGDLSVRNRSF